MALLSTTINVNFVNHNVKIENRCELYMAKSDLDQTHHSVTWHSQCETPSVCVSIYLHSHEIPLPWHMNKPRTVFDSIGYMSSVLQLYQMRDKSKKMIRWNVFVIQKYRTITFSIRFIVVSSWFRSATHQMQTMRQSWWALYDVTAIHDCSNQTQSNKWFNVVLLPHVMVLELRASHKINTRTVNRTLVETGIRSCIVFWSNQWPIIIWYAHQTPTI